MRTKLLGIAGTIAFACLGACFVGQGQIDSTGSSNAALQCPVGERGFNGACRAICSETQPCGVGSICAGIDTDVAVCLEPSVTCSYLGDDTVCAGNGGYYHSYGSRGGPATTYVSYSSYPAYGIDPSTLTGESDPYFTPYNPYGSYANVYGYQGAVGCKGNARWQPAPLTGSVACRERHKVKRCRLRDNQCRLVSGTTEETVLPAP